jgi:hypothetical protein
VFDICKRHRAHGDSALEDAVPVRKLGSGRRLTPEQEKLLRRLMLDDTPDALQLTAALWTRDAASRLIQQRLGIRLPVRTLGAYLQRWGQVAVTPADQGSSSCSAVMGRWWVDVYPGLLARSKIEDGEVHWIRCRAEHDDPGRAVLSTVTSRGVQRWKTLPGALDVYGLIDFLRRLVQGASKKLFVIAGAVRARDDELAVLWLAEHVDSIEVIHAPAG